MLEYLLEFLILLLIVFAGYLVWDRYLRRPSRPDPALYVEALRDLLDGRHESAFTKLRQVVSDNPGNVDAYLRLGQILRENNQPQRALQVHRDLTLRTELSRPDKIAILRQIAADCLAADDVKLAEAAIRELLEMDKDNYWAHTQLLHLQEKNRQWGAAYDTAVQILRLEGNKSKKPLARFKMRAAEQLHKQREYHKARIVYKEAIGLDPQLVSAYLAIGDSYYEEQRYDDAVTFWNKLISVVPDEGHQVIGRLKKAYFNLGKFGEIQNVCERILDHSPRNPEARKALAEFYTNKGDLDMAVQMWEGLVDDYPDNDDAVLSLIGAYLERGDGKKVSQFLKNLEQRRASRKGGPSSGPEKSTPAEAQAG